jgi:DNA-binding IclR family transcriptional regulator
MAHKKKRGPHGRKFKLKVKYIGHPSKFISGVKIRKAAKPLLKVLREQAGEDMRLIVMAGGHKVIDK